MAYIATKLQSKIVDKAVAEIHSVLHVNEKQLDYLTTVLNCIYDLGRNEYKINTAHRRPIGKFNLDWVLLEPFDSLKQAAIEQNVTLAAISRSVKRNGIVAKKFRYKYL